MTLRIEPIELREARRFVAENHRHNDAPRGHRFSIGLWDGDRLVGVVIVGRPRSRIADDGLSVELYRVTTDGTRNACTMLYGAACRAAKAMGYRRAETFTTEEEPGTSLLAAGFRPDRVTQGRNAEWRYSGRDEQMPLLVPAKTPIGPKQKWVRDL